MEELHLIHPFRSIYVSLGAATLKFVQEALHSTLTGSALFLLLKGPKPFSNGKKTLLFLSIVYMCVLCLYTESFVQTLFLLTEVTYCGHWESQDTEKKVSAGNYALSTSQFVN